MQYCIIESSSTEHWSAAEWRGLSLTSCQILWFPGNCVWSCECLRVHSVCWLTPLCSLSNILYYTAIPPTTPWQGEKKDNQSCSNSDNKSMQMHKQQKHRENQEHWTTTAQLVIMSLLKAYFRTSPGNLLQCFLSKSVWTSLHIQIVHSRATATNHRLSCPSSITHTHQFTLLLLSIHIWVHDAARMSLTPV